MAFMPFSLSSPARSACVHALLQWRLKSPAAGVRACGLYLTGRWLQSEHGVGRTKQWDETRVLAVPVQLVHERQRMAATSSTLSSSALRRQGLSGSAHEHVLVEASR